MWGKKGVKKGGRKGVAKKGWKKSKRGFNTKLTVNRAIQPYAQRYICTMKYAESVGLTTNASILAQHNFNLNSIFDPNRTGIGHQPYGHDTAQSIYNRYRVIGCYYAISVQNVSGSVSNVTANTQLSAIPSNEVLVLSSNAQIRESPRARYLVQNVNSPVRTLKGYCDIKSLMGRNKSQYMADDRYQAQFGSDPNELAILNVTVGDMSENFESQLYTLLVELKYVVECFDIKQLPQS